MTVEATFVERFVLVGTGGFAVGLNRFASHDFDRLCLVGDFVLDGGSEPAEDWVRRCAVPSGRGNGSGRGAALRGVVAVPARRVSLIASSRVEGARERGEGNKMRGQDSDDFDARLAGGAKILKIKF